MVIELLNDTQCRVPMIYLTPLMSVLFSRVCVAKKSASDNRILTPCETYPEYCEVDIGRYHAFLDNIAPFKRLMFIPLRMIFMLLFEDIFEELYDIIGSSPDGYFSWFISLGDLER